MDTSTATPPTTARAVRAVILTQSGCAHYHEACLQVFGPASGAALFSSPGPGPGPGELFTLPCSHSSLGGAATPRPTRQCRDFSRKRHCLLNMPSIYCVAQCLLLLAMSRFEGVFAQEGTTTAKIARMEFVSCPGCKLNRLPEASRLICAFCQLVIWPCGPMRASGQCNECMRTRPDPHFGDASPQWQVKRFLKDVIEAGNYPGVTVNL